MNAAAISARTIHGTQRSDGELPPPDGGRGPALGRLVGRAAGRRSAVPGRARVGTPRRRGRGRVGRSARGRARLAGIGFDPGFEIGLAAAHPRAGSSSWIAPCYGPTAGPTERERERSVSDFPGSTAATGRGFRVPPVACPAVSSALHRRLLRPVTATASAAAPAAVGSSPSAVPGARRRVRWGIGDVIAAFASGSLVSVVVGRVRGRSRPPEPPRSRSSSSSARRTSPSSPGWRWSPGARAPGRSAATSAWRSVRPAAAWFSDLPVVLRRHRPAAGRRCSRSGSSSRSTATPPSRTS